MVALNLIMIERYSYELGFEFSVFRGFRKDRFRERKLESEIWKERVFLEFRESRELLLELLERILRLKMINRPHNYLTPCYL